MASNVNDKKFEFRSDALDSYIDSGVGVIHLKDKVFEMAVDFSLETILFERLKIAAVSSEIKTLLVMSNHSILSEDKDYQFLKKVIELRDETGEGDFHGTVDPITAISRVDSTLNQYILGVLQYNKFMVTAVQGSVVGQFLGTILAGDYRIASEDTVFSFPHFKYGLPPRGVIAYLLPRFIGYAKAKQILMQGKSLNAAQAKQLDLLDIIIPVESFEKKCLKIAKEFTKLPSNVISMTKKLLFSNIKELEEYIKLESELTNIYQVNLPPKPDNK